MERKVRMVEHLGCKGHVGNMEPPEPVVHMAYVGHMEPVVHMAFVGHEEPGVHMAFVGHVEPEVYMAFVGPAGHGGLVGRMVFVGVVERLEHTGQLER